MALGAQRTRGLSALDMRTIAGSGLFWAWFDALFMSAFFPDAPGTLAEAGVMAMDGASALALAFAIALMRRGRGSHLRAWHIVAAGVMGTAGSLLFVLVGTPGVSGTPALIAAGGFLTGTFAGAAGLGWGALYSMRGAASALTRVSGAFTFAVLADIPLLFMEPVARCAFYALMPLASCLVLASVSPAERSYPPASQDTAAAMPPATERTSADASPRAGEPTCHPVRRLWRSAFVAHLGVSPAVLGSLMLVMVGFGYTQHLVSFATPQGSPLDWGATVQLARGLTAGIVFVMGIARPQAAQLVWRAGFLLMIGGFMANAFFLGTSELWVSGTVIICGYTVFDVLLWVIAAQAAREQSREPACTVALVRALAAICYVAGAAVGLALAGPTGTSPWAVQESNVIGYLVVIAVVVLMGADDIWALLSPAGPNGTAVDADAGLPRPAAGGDPAPSPYAENVVPALLDELGLTAREREVAVLLVRGRTQPWIAETLGISANTVGTHMRHIYQKAGVHDRREFLDRIGGA